MTAAVYVRISQDREGGGLGVQRQEDDCRQLAASLGLEVGDVYRDNDVSAYSGKRRPEYLRLLEDVKSGRVTSIIAWHTDRLHRSYGDLVTYMDVTKAIPTYTVTSGVLDLTTPSGRMTAVITAAVAQQEVEHKSERQKRKADELAAKGLPLGGGRPFGYESDGLTIRETEAAELRNMVARVLAGDSLAAVMRDLNERGVVTTRGKAWVYSSFRSLLLRERNCGRMVHRGKVIGKAAWEPIISETNHDALAALLNDPARRTTTTPARRHLLSGLAKCSCGEGMKPGWVPKRSGGKHWLYTCPVRTPGHAHRAMSRVDEYVVERVLDVLSVVTVHGDDTSPALEVERDELTRRLDEAAELFAAGSITAQQLSAISQRLSERLEVIKADLTAHTRGTALEGAVNIDRDAWDALPLDRKRKIIDAVMTVTIVPVNGARDVLGVNAKIRTGGRFGFRVTDELKQTIRAAVA